MMFESAKQISEKEYLSKEDESCLFGFFSCVESVVVQELEDTYKLPFQFFYSTDDDGKLYFYLFQDEVEVASWDYEEHLKFRLQSLKLSINSKELIKRLRTRLESAYFDVRNDKLPAHYEVRFEVYQRYGNGGIRTIRFRARNDWFALLAIILKKAPTIKNVYEHFSDYQELQNLFRDFPTAQLLSDHIAANYWGDGDDFIFYLKNLDTDRYLYQSDEASEVEVDEDCDDDLDD